jgi:hypothetical protein
MVFLALLGSVGAGAERTVGCGGKRWRRVLQLYEDCVAVCAAGVLTGVLPGAQPAHLPGGEVDTHLAAACGDAPLEGAERVHDAVWALGSWLLTVAPLVRLRVRDSWHYSPMGSRDHDGHGDSI